MIASSLTHAYITIDICQRIYTSYSLFDYFSKPVSEALMYLIRANVKTLNRYASRARARKRFSVAFFAYLCKFNSIPNGCIIGCVQVSMTSLSDLMFIYQELSECEIWKSNKNRVRTKRIRQANLPVMNSFLSKSGNITKMKDRKWRTVGMKNDL